MPTTTRAPTTQSKRTQSRDAEIGLAVCGGLVVAIVLGVMLYRKMYPAPQGWIDS